ncbi:peptidoglycan-binding protein [Cyanobium sp. ATX 6F1]|uniref:C40 family peptidase n=1 Tax=unclassified Cyanobium TaxID=2627006 RepID=UPI0020CB736A|nr:peptidoglycan-binding protein [Cyanobium sp. ATX 6F1]MCP9915813.1 peptidoglycan-binding protein [Cyanobium sp. ATX 6F1]
MTTAADVLRLAAGEIGFGETASNNITKYGAWYGLQSEWCGLFCSYVFHQAGLPLQVTTAKGFSYCPFAVAWFKERGWWIEPRAGAQPGDLVFFDWYPGTADSDAWHVGLVESIQPSGQVICINGNIGPFPARVRRDRHPMANVYGYGRPRFDGLSAPAEITGAPAWPGIYRSLTSPLSAGQDVLAWQRRLIQLGWNLGASGPTGQGDDGSFGPVSYQQLMAFQRAAGLEVDGILGPESWRLAFAENAPRGAEIGSNAQASKTAE